MNPSAHTYKKMAKIMTLIKDHNIIPGQILSSHMRWKKRITVGISHITYKGYFSSSLNSNS